jgi:hypothetical protein
MVRRGVRPFTFEEESVTIVLASSFEVEELTATMQAILAHPDFTRGRDVVMDARGSDVNPNLADIKSMLATLHAVSSEFSGCWAVVVSDALRFGLARMASSLGSSLGLKINAFHTPEEAKRWLIEERTGPAGRP